MTKHPPLQPDQNPAVMELESRLATAHEDHQAAEQQLERLQQDHATLEAEVLRAEGLAEIGEGNETEAKRGRKALEKLTTDLKEARQAERRKHYAVEHLEGRLMDAEEAAGRAAAAWADTEATRLAQAFHKALQAAIEANERLYEFTQDVRTAQVRSSVPPLAWAALLRDPHAPRTMAFDAHPHSASVYAQWREIATRAGIDLQ